MIRHYLTVAVRTLRRERGYAAINVAGLGLGIAAALLLSLYVRHELAFDRFHAHGDRLHRVWLEEQDHGERLVNVSTPLPLADRLEADFPEVERAVRLFAFTDRVRRGDLQFAERVHLAGPAFFEAFSFPLVAGDAATALADPRSVVLSEAVARKYFGDEDPVGQALEVRVGREMQAFTVTGVAAAPPRASSVQFGLVVPFEPSLGAFNERAWDAWQQVYGETYVLLRPGADAAALEARLPEMVRRVRPDLAPEAYAFHLQPLADIHLDPSLPAGLEPTTHPAYPASLAALALLILLVACVNFVTLAVGRSARRAREVGVRKALGAGRGALRRQFWGEAAVITALALGAGFALALLALPLFNGLAGTALAFEADAAGVALTLGAAALVTLAAGSYPAAVLARFSPVDALRDRLGLRGDKSLLRRGLVVGQFALATALVAGTLLMAEQLDFLRRTPLGFDRERVVLLPMTGGSRDGLATYERLRAELARDPAVAGVTASAFGMNEPWAEVGYETDAGAYRTFRLNFAGYEFAETLRIPVVAGRTFARAVPSDTARGLVVNEALARAHGWSPAEAVGRRLPGPFPDHEILGVLRDFHYASLHRPIEPLVLTPKPDLVLRGATNMMFEGETALDVAVRLAPGAGPEALERLEATWRRVAPDQPFAFAFLDGTLDRQYRQEARLGQILTTAAALAIAIACLGLFGLAALTASRRTKEVGVRKVLGASVPNLVALLSRDFAALVFVGFALAVPAVYAGASVWLDGFAYRIAIGPGVFVLAGALALGVALLTVGYHAWRAATADPVRALRYE